MYHHFTVKIVGTYPCKNALDTEVTMQIVHISQYPLIFHCKISIVTHIQNNRINISYSSQRD